MGLSPGYPPGSSQCGGWALPGCLHRATDPDLTCPDLQRLRPCHRATWRPAPWAGPRPTLRQQQGHHVGPLLVVGPLGGFFKSCLVNLTIYETPGTQWAVFHGGILGTR